MNAHERPPPFLLVAYALSFVGAAMLVVVPFLPLAHIGLLGETIDLRADGSGWAIALTGVVAAACPGLAIGTRRPLWTVGVIVPAVVSIGWSGWYSMSRVPEMARFADSATLGWGGLLFVFAGPVLLIAGLAALVAAYTRRRVPDAAR